MTDDQSKPLHVPFAPLRMRTRLRSRFLLIAIAVVLLVLGAAVWGIQMAFHASNRKATRMNFAQVGLGLTNYSEEVWGHLPYPVRRESVDQPAKIGSPNGTGRSLYSWRVEIVPYLVSWHGSWDQSKPWNDPANKQLVELSYLYAYDAVGPEGHPESFPEANAFAITGPGTAFGDGKEPPKALKDVPPDTILVVETRASGIPWPAPGDFDIRTMPKTINAPDGRGISSRHARGFHVIFADGEVWFLSDKVPFETLEKFFTTAEAKKHDREKLLRPFLLHRGP